MSGSIRGLMTVNLLYSPGSLRYLRYPLAHPRSTGKVIRKAHHRGVLAGDGSGIACAGPRCHGVPGGQVVALLDACHHCNGYACCWSVVYTCNTPL